MAKIVIKSKGDAETFVQNANVNNWIGFPADQFSEWVFRNCKAIDQYAYGEELLKFMNENENRLDWSRKQEPIFRCAS